jgi:transposase InsO family protein
VDRLTDAFDWFTHSWHAFVGAWLITLVGMWAGLWLRGANRGRFLTAPIPAAFVALLAMLAAAALKAGLDAADIAGPLLAYGTFAIFPLFGLLAGLLSSDPARTVLHRGAVIQDGQPLQRRGRGEQLTLADVRALLRWWQHDYNDHRPHGSLGRLTPSEFAAKGQKSDPEAPKL